MRSNAEYAEATALADQGLNDCQISRTIGIPRGTIRDWRNGLHARRRAASEPTCPRCGYPEHNGPRLPRARYAYLLGMYLGDGSIDRVSRAWRLRIALDMRWRGIMRECADAMQKVFSENRVLLYQPDSRSRCAVAVVHSNQLVCLFPQHGRGAKHLRPIKLEAWQDGLVREHPEQFLRGLIHSDGCRFMNRVRAGGKLYAYPRYNFTSASEDIRGLFTATCEQLGIDWRQMNARNISIARNDSVARLDGFVGPKR